MKVRNLFQRERVSITFTEPSRARQEFRDECDINNILARYKDTGQLTHIAQTIGEFGDFSTSMDYHEAQNRVIQAKEAFGELPSHIRTAMKNDPGQLLAFINDPDNREEAITLGLIDKPEVPLPPKTRIEPDPSTPPPTLPQAENQASTSTPS